MPSIHVLTAIVTGGVGGGLLTLPLVPVEAAALGWVLVTLAAVNLGAVVWMFHHAG